MEKINVAELLKNCPSGMELDCTIWDNVTFIGIEDIGYINIIINTPCGTVKLSNEGCFSHNCNSAKCVIFPKGKTTWEGFVPPRNFKDGDVIFTHAAGNYAWVSIFKQFNGNSCCTYIDLCINNNDLFPDTHPLCYIEEINTQRLATEKEREELFQAIKDNGYKWNTETKTLEKLPKFEDGDIVANDSVGGAQVFIFKEYIDSEKNYVHCYMILDNDGAVDFEPGFCYVERFATEEEKQKLFDAIKDNGYKWNEETKTLEKLIKPEFKVGNKITFKCEKDKPIISITEVKDGYYLVQYFNIVTNNYQNEKISFEFQDNYELVPNKFDITTLKPFDKVLVRMDNKHVWSIQFFERLNTILKDSFVCMGGGRYHQCIPYEGNEHLLNKVVDCDEFYRTWEKTGD